MAFVWLETETCSGSAPALIYSLSMLIPERVSPWVSRAPRLWAATAPASSGGRERPRIASSCSIVVTELKLSCRSEGNKYGSGFDGVVEYLLVDLAQSIDF